MSVANPTATSIMSSANLNKVQCLALKGTSIFDTQIQKVEWNTRSEVPTVQGIGIKRWCEENFAGHRRCIIEGEIALCRLDSKSILSTV